MSVLNIKPQYLYATLLDENTAVSEGIATTPSACAHSGGCLTGKEVSYPVWYYDKPESKKG